MTEMVSIKGPKKSTLVNELQKVHFVDQKEEDFTAIFDIQDLIKEYNARVLKESAHACVNKPLLSPHPSTFDGSQTYIRAMTKEEVEAMRRQENRELDWLTFTHVVKEQFSPSGLVSHFPDFLQGLTFARLVNELGLMGRVIYKEVGAKIYVILKGYPGLRSILKGTVYLNGHPEIVNFGIAKVNIGAAVKTGFKTSIAVYGAVKLIQAAQMFLEDGELQPSFFKDIPAELIKLTASNLVGAGVGALVVTAKAPAALGMGIALLVGLGVGLGLDYLDEKYGFKEAVYRVLDKLWENAKSEWKKHLQQREKAKKAIPSSVPFFIGDPLLGLDMRGVRKREQIVRQQDNSYVYIV